ncbi:MAG: hypothetical protein DRN26_00355 [Thermoplasmata archaeon]|nr:MAG: hypothetical protein DRN26_00355 [Thermoplasmata archaeon]
MNIYEHLLPLCKNCQYSNINSDDYEDGLIKCKFDGDSKDNKSICNLKYGERVLFKSINEGEKL